MSKLESLSAFDGVLVPGRSGAPDGDAGVTAFERKDLGLATVEARKGQGAALKSAVRDAYGVGLPDGSAVAQGEVVTFIGTGPGQWFAVSATLENEALADALSAKLKGLASVADQSSGRAVLRIQGPRARDMLAKGLAIDLDPIAFPPTRAVTSTISHMGVLVWCETESGVYDIALFRSVAASFWRWLQASAAEYGCDVITGS